MPQPPRPELDNLSEWQMQARTRATLDQADAAEQEALAMVRAWNRRHPESQPITIEDLR